MNYEQANKILDRSKEGWQFSEFVTLKALELTGDYEPNGSAGMDTALQKENAGTWEAQSVRLVAEHVDRHCQKTGRENSRGFASAHECEERTK
jgi:hypothetical protein